MRLILLFGLCLAVFAPGASAQQIVSIAISPDGATVMVAGDNRALYRVDPATLAVTERRHVPGQVAWMEFSGDGETLLLHDGARGFAALDAGSFKERYSAEDIRSLSYAPEAGRIVLLDSNYKRSLLQLISASSGKRMGEVELPDIRADEVVLNADGSRALVLTPSSSSDSEEKAQPGSELKGFAKYDFRQRHDGYVSQVVDVDLKAATFAVADTWYRVNRPVQKRMVGDAAIMVKTVSDSALLLPDGSTKMIDLGEKYMSSMRISNDDSAMYMASGRELWVYAYQDGALGDLRRNVKAESLDGPSERITTIAEAADGTLYLGTSAYRLLKLAPGATVFEAAPIF